MGFRARSADSVYRYAFRRGGGQDRSLGDGFGWTIVLLGDTGAFSQEFLVRYGVELSIATAHRVRFVFFSGMSRDETTRVLNNAGDGARALRSFLDRMRLPGDSPYRRHRRLDWEQQPWQELRPPAFVPLTDADAVQGHLSRHRVWDSAIPGAAAARVLAQKLGIGRHVPCLLVFTDIGAPRYHVLPVQSLTPEEVYHRVRGWVDSYYEINRETLAHWSAVEERVHALATMARVSLATVRDWPKERRDDWLALSLLGECARLARDHPEAALEQLGVLSKQYGSFYRVGGDLFSLTRDVQELEGRERSAEQLRETARTLRAAAEPRQITDALTQLAQQRPVGTSAETRKAIAAAVRSRSEPLPLTRREELFAWWRSLSKLALGRRRFARLRYAWRELYEPQLREGESSAEHAHRDYTAFWTALTGHPLSAEPELVADHVFAQLADHYGISADAPAWTQATGNAREQVTKALGRSRRSAPQWLLDVSPPLLLHECLFLSGVNEDALQQALFSSFPRLSALVRGDTARVAARSARSTAEHLAHRDEVAAALLTDADRLETQPVDRAGLYTALEARFTGIQADFRLGMARDATAWFDRRSGIAHLEGNLRVAEKLSAALAEYDAAVRAVVYPHMSDPLVEALPTPPHLEEAFGLDGRPATTSAMAVLRRSFTGLRDDTREALSRQDQARSEGAAWAPEARLADVLTTVCAPSRAAEVLEPWPAATARESVARAVRDGRATELLGALGPRERTRMLELARPADTPPPRLGPQEVVAPAVLLSVFGLPSSSRPPAGDASTTPRVRVFISYAHEDDGGAHTERVRTFWTLLRSLGVDARLDQSAAEQPQDWALWMHNEYRAADYVLVVASPAYKRRAEGTEIEGIGNGVVWEARFIRDEVYSDGHGWHRRILKVVLPGGSPGDLPAYLGGPAVSHYAIDSIDAEGVERLLRYLTRQPYEVAEPLGPVPHLPPRGA
ncbi:TIR domain-containing protein [Streptomyces sp. NPDC048720]|uniref:TIR domain-containing protein n=1 Tax=Streptomyces sp. NPDC048720 TaxID=3365588 RepID=UPI0037188931